MPAQPSMRLESGYLSLVIAVGFGVAITNQGQPPSNEKNIHFL
jgi:hypothetical protein